MTSKMNDGMNSSVRWTDGRVEAQEYKHEDYIQVKQGCVNCWWTQGGEEELVNTSTCE